MELHTEEIFVFRHMEHHTEEDSLKNLSRKIVTKKLLFITVRKICADLSQVSEVNVLGSNNARR